MGIEETKEKMRRDLTATKAEATAAEEDFAHLKQASEQAKRVQRLCAIVESLVTDEVDRQYVCDTLGIPYEA